jgi:hypothetical protein
MDYAQLDSLKPNGVPALAQTQGSNYHLIPACGRPHAKLTETPLFCFKEIIGVLL